MINRKRVARVNRIKERNYRNHDCRDCVRKDTHVCEKCVRKRGLDDEAFDYFEHA